MVAPRDRPTEAPTQAYPRLPARCLSAARQRGLGRRPRKCGKEGARERGRARGSVGGGAERALLSLVHTAVFRSIGRKAGFLPLPGALKAFPEG